MKKPDTESVKMRLEKNLRDRVHEEAKKTCRSWQDMVRHIIKEYFK
jgi:predicted DNA-binding protein